MARWSLYKMATLLADCQTHQNVHKLLISKVELVIQEFNCWYLWYLQIIADISKSRINVSSTFHTRIFLECIIYTYYLNLFFVVFHWMNNKLTSAPAMALVRNKEQAIGLVYWRVNESLGLDESLYCKAIGFSCMYCDHHVYLWNIHSTQFRVHNLKQTTFLWVSCVNFLGSNV